MNLQKKKTSNINEKKELLNIFKEMWQKSNSPLHRIYASWEDLVNHVDVEEDKTEDSEYTLYSCPHCKATQQIKRSTRRLFPYQNCISCSESFFIDKDYTLRKLTSEEKENMPQSWIQIIDEIEKKKLSIVFKLD